MAEKGIEDVIKSFEEEVDKSEELVKSEEEEKEEKDQAEKSSVEETDEEKKKREEKEKAKKADKEDKEDKEDKAEKSEATDPAVEAGEEATKSEEPDVFNEKLAKSLELVIKSYQANSEQVEQLRKSIEDLSERITQSETNFEEFSKSISETEEEIVEKSIEEVEEEPSAKSVTYAAKNAMDDVEEGMEALEKSEIQEPEVRSVFNQDEATRRLVEKSRKGELTLTEQDHMKKSIFNLIDGSFTEVDVNNINKLME